MDVNTAETWRWIWLVVAVVAAVGEIAVAGSFFLLPFAFGAAVASAMSFLGASVSLSWLSFVVVSALLSAVMRPLSRRLDRSAPVSEAGSHRWVGRQGQVLEDIPAGPGETGLIRLDREQWRAESMTGQPIPAGSIVRVNRVDGTRLVVVLVDAPPDLGLRKGD